MIDDMKKSHTPYLLYISNRSFLTISGGQDLLEMSLHPPEIEN